MTYLVRLVAVVALSTLASCSSNAPAPTHEPIASPSSTVWRPAKPISHQSVSEAEAVKLRLAQLVRVAKTDQLKNPPKVDLVRWTTMQDYGPTMAACLQDAGFNAVAVGGSGLEYPEGITTPQMSAFGLADYECSAKYTMHPRFGLQWTGEQWGLMYDYSIDWLVPCLKALGKAIPDAPTRETYVAKNLNGERDWEPYNAVEMNLSSVEDRVQLSVSCPQYPQVEDMWG